MDALSSIMDQTLDREFFEVIVTKNFSDNEIDRFLRQNSVKEVLYAQEGIGNRIADVLKYCNGKIITFLEDDDIYHPMRLEQILRAFTSFPGLVLYHNHSRILESLKEDKAREGFDSALVVYSTLTLQNKRCALREVINNRAGYNLSSVAIDKELILKNAVLLSPLKTGVDTMLFYISINTIGNVGIERRDLTLVRMHESATNAISSLKSFMEKKRKVAEDGRISYRFINGNIKGNRFNDLLSCEIIDNTLDIMLYSASSQRKGVLSAITSFIRCSSYSNKRFPLFKVPFILLLVISPSLARYLFSSVIFFLIVWPNI